MKTKNVILSLFLCSTFLFNSNCKKTDNHSNSTDPAAELSSILGSFSPTDGIANVVLRDGSGVILDTLLYPKGAYKFNNLKTGKYSVELIPITGYDKPGGYSIDLGKSVDFNLGNATLNKNSDKSELKFTLDGTNYAYFSPPASVGFRVTGFEIYTNNGSASDFWTLRIALNNVNSTGTYSLPNGSGFFQWFHMNSSNIVDGNWTEKGGGNAEIKITEFDYLTRQVSGTFSGTVIPQGATVGTNKSFTNGSFSKFNF